MSESVAAKEKLQDFIRYAGEVFGYAELVDPELDIDIARVDDPDYPFYCTDLAREETNEVYRFCLLEKPASLDELLDYCFGQYRDLEDDYEGEFEGYYLLLRPDSEEAEDFLYVFRTDSGEVGLFHSTLSIDDDGEEDDDEDLDKDDEEGEDEDKTNGRRGL